MQPSCSVLRVHRMNAAAEDRHARASQESLMGLNRANSVQKQTFKGSNYFC